MLSVENSWIMENVYKWHPMSWRQQVRFPLNGYADFLETPESHQISTCERRKELKLHFQHNANVMDGYVINSTFAVHMRKLKIETKPGNNVAADSASDEQPDLNNHHTIPRESWNDGQNPYAPATNTQGGH
ncbi:hypothetical protein ACH5RR_005513 [Cinchona calisaya]|uniref:Uncharacterized protein n=1 Tax=Cinchona calisaya TaxID=153742 RepID=A0ABD3ALB7_9GENT